MILPNVRPGLRHKSRKRARRQAAGGRRQAAGGRGKGEKKNVTIAVNVAQFTFLGGCYARKWRQATARSKRLNVRTYRLRRTQPKSGLSIRESTRGHGHANCSPERPKQNFLPTLTS
jgi:hypothetical protein